MTIEAEKKGENTHHITSWNVRYTLTDLHSTVQYLPEPAGFLHSSQLVSSTGKGSLLVAATLATRRRTTKGAVDSDDLGIRVEFLDYHLEGMVGSTEKPTATVGIFKGMEDLIRANKVFEFGLCFASKQFLKASTAGLTDFHLGATTHVRLEG
jgi:hypothetical protein